MGLYVTFGEGDAGCRESDHAGGDEGDGEKEAHGSLWQLLEMGKKEVMLG